jgi:hypothetical protein
MMKPKVRHKQISQKRCKGNPFALRVKGAQNIDWKALSLFRLPDNAYLFSHRPKNDWPRAFQKKPQRLLFETLVQQEAITSGFYGKSVWLTSERRPAPLVRIELER